MKKLPIALFAAFFIALTFILTNNIKAQANDCSNPTHLNLDAIGRCLEEIQRAYELSIKATKPLESQLNSLQTQINGIKNRVKAIESDIEVKKENISEGYKNLEKQQTILYAAIRNFYIKSHYNSPILAFLSAQSASEITKALAYQKAAENQDKVIIINIAISIADLELKKKNLESEQTRLASIKASLDEESAKLDKIVSGARAYQGTLSSQIAALSQKQQEILGQRLAGLNIPRSAGTGAPACVDDRDKDPGFPGTRLAFFTYGVPNRTGLNQYGAWGRAKAQQDYKTILNAYFTNFELKEDYDENIQIHVVDSGIDMTLNIEEYVKRIYEMPDSWTENDSAALKAQAIAARSYALSYTNNGQNSICASQKCQVFKSEPKGGNWNTASDATRGDVMVQNGSPVKAWYSSTHGGYVFPTSELPGWSATSWTKRVVDTTTGSAGSFGDLHSNAYDRESPWFYCDWGLRIQYNKTAWLTSSEVADIVNIILLARTDSSTKEKLYQTDKPHPYGGELWNQDRVKSELKSRNITPYNSISDVSVSADFGNGKTNSINLTGDAGSQSFDGPEFKDWFNLRAPANIQIVGPLFNVERK